MMHKYSFEALDKSLKDVMQCMNQENQHIPFSEKVVVFAGYSRQILLVISKGTKQEILYSLQRTVLTYGIFVMC